MKKNEVKTNAVRLLEQKKINFKMHTYFDTPSTNGEEIAALLHEDPFQTFKTLVTVGKSGNHYIFMIPVNQELDLKKAANAVKEKNIEMIKSKELLPLTGYVHGGCSPLGMKKFFTTVIDETAELFDTIIFSGGMIGLQVEMSLDELKKMIPFTLVDLVVDK